MGYERISPNILYSVTFKSIDSVSTLFFFNFPSESILYPCIHFVTSSVGPFGIIVKNQRQTEILKTEKNLRCRNTMEEARRKQWIGIFKVLKENIRHIFQQIKIWKCKTDLKDIIRLEYMENFKQMLTL